MNLRVKFRPSVYQVWFDCPLYDYKGVLPWAVTTVMIVPSLLCCLIFNVCPLPAFSKWFRQDSGVVSVWLSGKPTLHKSWSLHLSLSPSFLLPYQLRKISTLFPCWGLLTALKAWKESHRSRLQNQPPCLPLSGGKVTFTLSQSSVATSRSIIHQRGSSDTIATQSTAWQLDRLPQATSHIPSQSISDKPAETGHQSRR